MKAEMFFRALRNELLKLFSRRRSYLGFVVFVLAEFIVVWLWHSRVLKEPLAALLGENGLRWEDCSSALSIASFAVSFGVGLVAGSTSPWWLGISSRRNSKRARSVW